MSAALQAMKKACEAWVFIKHPLRLRRQAGEAGQREQDEKKSGQDGDDQANQSEKQACTAE